MARSSSVVADRDSSRCSRRARLWQGTTNFAETLPVGSEKASWFLESAAFQCFINVVIFANTFTIGYEQAKRMESKDVGWLSYVEHAFVAIYIAEILLRRAADPKNWYIDPWVRFDLGLVIVAVLASWVFPLFAMLIGIDTSKGALGVVMTIRTARLARLARALRLVRRFQPFWMLVHAFLSSARIMLWVTVLLTIMLYIFSAAGLEMITLRYREMDTIPDDVNQIVEAWFSNVSMTMLTLLQFVSFDSIGAIYRPLIAYDWTLIFFFTPVMLVVGIVLMNIITAIIVNSAMEQANEDRELKKMEETRLKEKRMRELRQVFNSLDIDGSGFVELEEIVGNRSKELKEELDIDTDPVEVFKMLDVDGGGFLSIDEFCNGLYQVTVSGTPLTMKHVEKQVDRIPKMEVLLERLVADMDSVKQTITCQHAPPLAERVSTCESCATDGFATQTGLALPDAAGMSRSGQGVESKTQSERDAVNPCGAASAFADWPPFRAGDPGPRASEQMRGARDKCLGDRPPCCSVCGPHGAQRRAVVQRLAQGMQNSLAGMERLLAALVEAQGEQPECETLYYSAAGIDALEVCSTISPKTGGATWAARDVAASGAPSNGHVLEASLCPHGEHEFPAKATPVAAVPRPLSDVSARAAVDPALWTPLRNGDPVTGKGSAGGCTSTEPGRTLVAGATTELPAHDGGSSTPRSWAVQL